MKDKNVKSKYKEYLDIKKKIEEAEMKISVQKAIDTKQYPTEFEELEVDAIWDIAKRKYYSNILWENGYRKSQYAKEVTSIILDIDGTDTIDRVQEILKRRGIKSHLITTKSHTSEKHHFRVIIEIKEMLTRKEDLHLYRDACLFLIEDLKIHADNTFDLARMYAPSSDNAQFTHIEGETLDIMEYIKKARLKRKITEQISLQEKVEKASKTENWLYADIQAIMDINIKDIIRHFEGIDREWKAGDEIYIRTSTKEKIAINEKENIAFSFRNMKGYGVIKFLAEKTGEKNINNIARMLEKEGFGSFLKINERIFNKMFNEAINQSSNIQEFANILKEKFRVKSVFVDLKNNKIKVAGIEKDITPDYALLLNTLRENSNLKTNKYNLET